MVVYQNIVNYVSEYLESQGSISQEVCKALADGIVYVYGAGIIGDIAEFGTMSGKTAVAIATAIRRVESSLSAAHLQYVCKEGGKELWLFDSFEGLPEA